MSNHKNYIIPEPQEIKYGNSCFQIDENTTLVLDRRLPDSFAGSLDPLLETIFENTGLKIPVVRQSAANTKSIKITEDPETFATVKNGDEAYSLEITPAHIVLAGGSAKGVFYGLQTLAQIVRNAPDGKVAALSIKDWPDLKIRGIHVCLQFYGPINVPFFKRLIKACAANKINTLEIGLDNMLIYDSYPEIAAPGAFSKEEMKAIIDYAAKYYIRIIPIIQSLGHVDHSIFSGFPDILETPEANTYCPSNEKVYEILFSVLDEVIELFNPPYLNIGHDEVDALGKCEKCRKFTPPEIFARDISRIHDHLKKRGVRTAMFGDMLLNPDGIAEERFAGYFKGGKPFNTYKALEKLPKDIIIADWHYDRDPRYVPSEDYPSVTRIKNAGLEVLGYCAWYRPANSYCFSKCALKNDLPGLIVTTWGPLTLKIPKAGGDTMQRLKYNPEALKGIERAAEYFWSVGRPGLAVTDEMANDFFWRELDYMIKDPGEEI
ncbi:MAG: beta-N-acetylhexosaminidase [Victivallales bacterium]